MLKINSSKRKQSQRILIHGKPGVGKTTFAATMPKPIALRTEDGMFHLDVPTFPICNSWIDAEAILHEIEREPKQLDGYRTFVVDSVDWLERRIWEQVAMKHDVQTLADIPYGRGYDEACSMLSTFLGQLDKLRRRKMHILLISHTHLNKVEPPSGPSYDRWEPRLHRKAAEMVIEWSDNIFYADLVVNTRTEDQGFGKKRNVVLGGEERVLWTRPAPGHVAKNRLDIPEDDACLPLMYESIKPFLEGE